MAFSSDCNQKVSFYILCLTVVATVAIFVYYNFRTKSVVNNMNWKLGRNLITLQQHTLKKQKHTSVSSSDDDINEEEFLRKGNNTLLLIQAIEKSVGKRNTIDPKFFFRRVRKSNDILIFKVRTMNQAEVSKGDFLTKLESLGFVPGTRIPPVIHFNIRFDSSDIQFQHALGILSAFHVLKPGAICLWHTQPRVKMTGFWQYLQKNFSASRNSKTFVYFVQTYKPEKIYGHNIRRNEHRGDILRSEILLGLGGSYFDLDVLSIRPWDELLRGHNFVIGRETGYGVGNSIMASSKNNLFVRIWHLAYQFFDRTSWAQLSVLLPHQMSLIWPKLLHIEPTRLLRPNWTDADLKLIYGKERKWKWRENYLIHLWYRFYKKNHTMESIKHEDNAFGDICRWVLFGNEKIIKSKA